AQELRQLECRQPLRDAVRRETAGKRPAPRGAHLPRRDRAPRGAGGANAPAGNARDDHRRLIGINPCHSSSSTKIRYLKGVDHVVPSLSEGEVEPSAGPVLVVL